MPSSVRPISSAGHVRDDRRADLRLGHAEPRQHLALALGGRATVAAHGRDDERLGAERPKLGDQRGGDLAEPADPAAADADRDALARPDQAADLGPPELFGDRRAHVVDAGAVRIS